ncbi:hypothetical protein AB0G42_21535 [Streptomyces yangpuensis]|uniref:hypothetical protein n=1 Tax=Streptomyces yangpuensis TaxID=1648182 RepID=UPI00343BBF43
MALRIFNTDPDAKPEPRKPVEYTRTEYAFQFRSGMQVYNPEKKKNEPVSLANWRVLTADPVVADAIAELLGGAVEEYDPTKELNLHVLTDSPSVEIVIEGSKSIEDKLILWGAAGPIHECDGEFFLSPPEDKGAPCGCPPILSERKELAKKRRGPSPAIVVPFRLAGHGYELGVGKLMGTAWSLAEVIHEVKEALDRVEGEALCRLELEHVQYVNKAGIDVSYRKPVITVLGSYNDAIGEQR